MWTIRIKKFKFGVKSLKKLSDIARRKISKIYILQFIKTSNRAAETVIKLVFEKLLKKQHFLLSINLISKLAKYFGVPCKGRILRTILNIYAFSAVDAIENMIFTKYIDKFVQ